MSRGVSQYYSPPNHSIITRNLNGRIDYVDSFSIILDKIDQYSIDEITTSVFTSFPGWIKALLYLRDTVVRPFGLATGADLQPSSSEKYLPYNIGDRAVIFMVIDRTDTEIVMAEDDKHLYLRTSLSVNKKFDGAGDELFLTTLVQFHNLWGRLYFVPVKPFHKQIMRSMLINFSKSVAKSGKSFGGKTLR